MEGHVAMAGEYVAVMLFLWVPIALLFTSDTLLVLVFRPKDSP